MPDRELNLAVDDGRHDIGFLAFLLTQPTGAHEWHLDGARRIRTGHGASPDPCNHGRLRAVGERRLRVQMPDALLSLVAHPRAVAAHVLGETGRFRPSCQAVFRSIRKHRSASRELRGDLDECLVDEHRDRVEVGGMCLETQALRLERDRATAREGVEDRWRSAVGRTHDLRTHLIEQRLITEIVPVDHPLDEPKETAPLGGDPALDERVNVGLAATFRFGPELVIPSRRVIY